MDGARYVYHDAASESCLGRDTHSAVSGGGVSAVLLLKMFSQRPFEPLHLAHGRPPYREKNKEPISSKLERKVFAASV